MSATNQVGKTTQKIDEFINELKQLKKFIKKEADKSQRANLLDALGELDLELDEARGLIEDFVDDHS